MSDASARGAAASVSDLDICRQMIRVGSRSFYSASLVLPRSVRDPAYALYAFCRLSDDAVDDDGSDHDAVDRLYGRLDRLYDGRPDNHPVDRAFADVVDRFAMPRALPEALLEGLAWDAEWDRGDRVDPQYNSLSDVRAYGVRVAGAVGAMMTVLMGERRPHVIARAVDLGVAMQLTNIARDVGEDARAGRLYLPRDWMVEEGLDPDVWLRHPVFDQRLGRVVERLLNAADGLYERADSGITALPVSCRPAIRAARYIYADIGHTLRRAGLDSVSVRTVVSARRKLALLAQATAFGKLTAPDLTQPSVPEGRYLCEAVASTVIANSGRPAEAWWDIDGQAERVIDLFTRLEKRDREIRLPSAIR